MKKTTCLILALLLCLSLTACGKTQDNPTTAPSDKPSNEQTTPSTNEPTSLKDNGNVLQVPAKEIYFDYPEGWTFSKETYISKNG